MRRALAGRATVRVFSDGRSSGYRYLLRRVNLEQTIQNNRCGPGARWYSTAISHWPGATSMSMQAPQAAANSATAVHAAYAQARAAVGPHRFSAIEELYADLDLLAPILRHNAVHLH